MTHRTRPPQADLVRSILDHAAHERERLAEQQRVAIATTAFFCFILGFLFAHIVNTVLTGWWS